MSFFPLCYICSNPITAILILLPLFYLLKKFFQGPKCNLKPDLSSKTILITGANTGIGKQTALELLSLGATVIIACRNVKKGEEAIKEIKEKTSNKKIEVMELDLSDLKSVRSFSQAFLNKFKKLDILINNAGIMALAKRELTKDGFEMQFGTNHLGHFLLTNLLLDVIKNTPQSRIINVSSAAHRFCCTDFEDVSSEKYYSAWRNYGRSKIANILFTRQLAKNLKGTQTKTVCLHPGFVRTELMRYMENESIVMKVLLTLFEPIKWFVAKDVKHGAQTTLFCALTDFDKLESGAFHEDCKVSKTSSKANDEELMKKLWEISVKAVKI